MGGETSRPTVANCEEPSVLNEIKRCTLAKLREVMEYWQREHYSRKNMTPQLLDDVLGHLISDSEMHFKLFSGPESHVISMEIFTVFAILSSDSAHSKVKYLFSWFGRDNPRVKGETIKIILEHVLNGVSKLFRTTVPPGAALDSLITASFTEASIQKFDKGEDVPNASGNSASGLHIPFEAVWEWCQDNKEVSEFLDAVLSACITPQSVTLTTSTKVDTSKVLAASMITVVEKSMNSALFFEKRNVLWKFKLKDLLQESWLEPVPTIDIEETVFAALELMAVRNIRAVAVTAYQEAVMTPSGSSSSMKGKRRGRNIFCGVLDYVTLASWLVECCPDSILTHAETKLKARVQHKTSHEINANAGNLIDFGSLLQSIGTLGNRNRRNSTTQQSNNVSYIGERFGMTSIREVMSDIAAHEAMQGLFLDRDDTATLCVEEYIYSAVLQFSKGYRTVPLRIGEIENNKVVHILSDIEMAQFIWENSELLLGNFRWTEVGRSGMMKIPAVMYSDFNLATALKVISTKKIDTGIVLVSANI
jgi:hypothetical protein